jgi:hypothetical protein
MIVLADQREWRTGAEGRVDLDGRDSPTRIGAARWPRGRSPVGRIGVNEWYSPQSDRLGGGEVPMYGRS